MTHLEQLRAAANTLAAIRPPIAFTESITIPVYQALSLINNVCEKMEKEGQAIIEKAQAEMEKNKPTEELPTEGVLYVDENQNGNGEAP